MIDELFCPLCKRLKKRCKCPKTLDPRMKKLEDFIRPIFDSKGETVYYHVFEPFAETPTEDIEFLPVKLQRTLMRRGIHKLYPYQKIAMNFLLQGKNVVITAPTGFGKTEAFVIPMLHRIANGKGIIFYPTKALAKDQELKIREYSETIGLKAVRFDGDSSLEERRCVFDGEADLILTNPDMVDYHLRKSESFRMVVRDVVFIAIDELHTYTGFLGSNMHYLIKRLSRFSDFQIACASATLANAKEFAEEMFEREFIHVDGQHRKARLHFVMKNCSNIYSTVREIVSKYPNRKILIFGNSYKVVETINWILRKSGIRSSVHKSGLTRELRNEIEKDFREGRIRVVVATPTLELGIDIGDVDIVISELVPYSQFLQRIGRAGRRGQESIGILLLRNDDPISAYYSRKPEEYFINQANGYVEKRNEEVMKFQFLSMISEKETRRDEVDSEILKSLILEGLVVDEYVLRLTEMGKNYLDNFTMRGVGDRIEILCRGEKIGERSLPVAIKELFPGAIFIHNGIRYQCLDIDLATKIAEVEVVDGGEEVTDPLYSSIPRIIRVEETINEPVNAVYTTLEVKMRVYGFVKRDIFRDKKTIYSLDSPLEFLFRTKGFLFSCPFPEDSPLEDFFAGSFHAVEHVLIESTNALTGGGSREMGGISTEEGDIFIYDATIGGNGLSKLLFRKLPFAFKISYDILTKCDCEREDGCPKCTYSYQCGSNNRPLNRKGAIDVIKKIIAGEIVQTNWKKYVETTKFRYFP